VRIMFKLFQLLVLFFVVFNIHCRVTVVENLLKMETALENYEDDNFSVNYFEEESCKIMLDVMFAIVGAILTGATAAASFGAAAPWVGAGFIIAAPFVDELNEKLCEK